MVNNMDRLTAEQIAKATDHISDNEKNRQAIRRLYHKQDENNLWPIRGKFNVTTRAVRNVGRFINETGYDLAGLEYCHALEGEMSRIVNDEKNW